MATICSTPNNNSSSPLSPRTPDKGSCFRCKKPGHWAKDCPTTTTTPPHHHRSPVPPSPAASNNYPFHYCDCGRGACVVAVSRSEKNPGRDYYRCPNTGFMNCKYFKWCDELKESEIRRVQPSDVYPICGCQAGVCTRVSHPSGRYKFVCPIPRGQGSCGFVKWQGTDDAGGSSGITSDKDNENNVAELPDDISEDALKEIGRIEENEANEMSPIPRDDPTQEVIEEGFIFESTTEGSVFSDRLGSSAIDNNETTNELRLIDPGRQIVAHTNSLSAGNTIQNFVLENSNLRSNIFCMEGWWGRIAYSPSQSLTLSTKRPFASSSTDTPFPEVEDPLTHGGEKRSRLNPCSGITSSDSSNLHISNGDGTVMVGTISRAFVKLGASIMDNLVALLESIDPKDHRTMSDESTVAFKALRSLGVDFTIFHERVTGFIQRAKHLSGIEEAISKDQWPSDLMNRSNIEKSFYEDVVSSHSQAANVLSASTERLQSARGEVSYLKDQLMEAEMELASCEVETADNQARLLRISEELIRSKMKWEKASKEAAEAVKQFEGREVEMSASKAAFDTAKAQLRRRRYS